MLRALFLIYIMGIAGCASTPGALSLSELPGAPVDAAAYFNPDDVGNDPLELVDLERGAISQHQISWFGKHWMTADEPSLFALSKDESRSDLAIYRLTELPTFSNPNIYTLRVAGDGTGLFEHKLLGGQGGYEPGGVISTTERLLSRSEVKRFTQALAGTGVFDRGLNCLGDPMIIILDGTRVIVESVDGDSFRMTNCGVRLEDPSMRALTLFREMVEADE